MSFAFSNRAARACSIEGQLALSHDHEHGEMLRYRSLALSFLPGHPHISQLMAMLGIECEQRLADLQTLARRLRQHHCLSEVPPRRLSPCRGNRLQLLVADDAVVRQVLDDALAAAQDAYRFTRLQARCTQVPELAALLERFAGQQRNEWRILEEAKESVSLHPKEGPTTPSLGTKTS